MPDLEAAHDFFVRVLGLRVPLPARPVPGPWPLDERAPRRRRHDGDATAALLPARRAGDLRGVRVRRRRPVRRTPAQQRHRRAPRRAVRRRPGRRRWPRSGPRASTVLGEPTASRGPSEGQRWVYFLAPWGMQFELVSYPHGKAFDHDPAALCLDPQPARRSAAREPASGPLPGRQPADLGDRGRPDPHRACCRRAPGSSRTSSRRSSGPAGCPVREALRILESRGLVTLQGELRAPGSRR